MITQLNHLYSDADLLEIATLLINHLISHDKEADAQSIQKLFVNDLYEDAIIFGICGAPQNIKISWETILALKAIHHSTQN